MGADQPSPGDRAIPSDVIRAQAERILASPIFATAPRMQRLLAHLVDQSLGNDDHELKEYALGVEVFDRGPDFDPRTDTIVRVQAGRLRRRLKAYYDGPGKDDPVAFEIPPGHYRVTFHPSDRPGDDGSIAERGPDSSELGPARRWWIAAVATAMIVCAGLLAWLYLAQTPSDDGFTLPEVPTAKVEPFDVKGDEPELAAFAEVIAEDLTNELNEVGLPMLAPADENTATFHVTGTLRAIGNDIRVSLRFVRTYDGYVHWTKTFLVPNKPAKLERFWQAPFLAKVLPLVIWMNYLQPDVTSSYEARQEFIKGEIEWMELTELLDGLEGNYGAAVAHLRRAIELDPEFRFPISQLGILYKNRLDWTLSYADAVGPAHEYARRELALDPDSTFLLGTINWTLDLDYTAAMANFEHARQHGHSTGEIEVEIGGVLLTQGRLEEAIDHFDTGSALGAHINRISAIHQKSVALLAAGRYAEARPLMDELPLMTNQTVHHVEAARAFYYADPHRARAMLDAAWTAIGGSRPEWFAAGFALMGDPEKAAELLALNEQLFEEGKLAAATSCFWGYYYLGDYDRAFVWLQRAIANREVILFPWLHRSPLLDDLRSDPRFEESMALLRRLEATGSPTTSTATR